MTPFKIGYEEFGQIPNKRRLSSSGRLIVLFAIIDINISLAVV